MSELLSKVAEILNAPESLVQRSAEARAEASGKSVDEVLQSWAGGESVAAVEKTVEEPAPVEEPVPVEEEAPVEEKDKEDENEIIVDEKESTQELSTSRSTKKITQKIAFALSLIHI